MKMATQESPELPSCHRHTTCTASQGALSFKRNPETSWKISTHQAKETIPTQKQVDKPETHSHHKPNSWHKTIQSWWNSQLLASPWGLKGLTPYLAPEFLRLPHKGGAFKAPSSESQWGLCPQNHKTTANKEAVANRHVSTHRGYSFRAQLRGKREKCPSPIHTSCKKKMEHS